jgi:transcriptional regulator of aromatic amino acid metabolism
MALLKSGGRAKAAFDALVLGPEKGNLGFRGAPRILGESLPIKEVRDTIRKLAEVDSAVLITGETGTGKELVARAVPGLDPRTASPYIATLPEPAFENEPSACAEGWSGGSPRQGWRNADVCGHGGKAGP